MSETLSSVEKMESFKFSVQKRAEEKLENNPEHYEKALSNWKERVRKASLDVSDEMTVAVIVKTEAARELLIEELYGDEIHLEEGLQLTSLRYGGAGLERVEGPSREGVADVASEIMEKGKTEGELYVINKLNEDFTPSNNYEAFVLREEVGGS